MVNSLSTSNITYIDVDVNQLYQQEEVYKKGSEAFLYLGNFLGKKVIIKERKRKLYRHPHLDSELRLFRLRSEARIIKLALKENLPVSQLLGVDLKNNKLIFEYFESRSLSHLIAHNEYIKSNELKSIFFRLGKIVGRMHDLNIIHGDLTPHNVLVSHNNTDPLIYLIDFGLAQMSPELELKTMDLFILNWSLRMKFWFDSFIKGYKEIISSDMVQKHLNSISQRGRYVKRHSKSKKSVNIT